MKGTVTTLVLILMLSGCAEMQLSTVWGLRDTDYLMVNPGVARIAMALPEGAILIDVVMELSFTRDGKLEIEHRIPFDILTDGIEFERMAFPAGHTSNIVLRIPANRVEDVMAYQRALLSARDGGPIASASMGISSRLNPQWLKEHCEVGNSSFKLQAWILVDNLDGYLPLIRGSEIMKLLSAESENFCFKAN